MLVGSYCTLINLYTFPHRETASETADHLAFSHTKNVCTDLVKKQKHPVGI